MIQIRSGHEIFVAYSEKPAHLIGHLRAIVDGLVGAQTHLELEELAQSFDGVQVNARLIVQEEMSHFAHFPLHAQVLGQHTIEHIRLGHFYNIEFGELCSGQIRPRVLNELRRSVLGECDLQNILCLL